MDIISSGYILRTAGNLVNEANDAERVPTDDSSPVQLPEYEPASTSNNTLSNSNLDVEIGNISPKKSVSFEEPQATTPKRSVAFENLRRSIVMRDELPRLANAFPKPTKLSANVDRELYEKKEFIIRLCKAIHSFGSPVHRTEYNMLFACKGIGLDAMFAVLPSLILICFGDIDRDPSKSDTHVLRVEQSLHCEKLALVDELCDAIGFRTITVEEGIERLDEILKMPPRFGFWITIICSAMSSGCIAPLFFGGGWIEFGVSAFLGALVGLLSFLSTKFTFVSRLFEATASTSVSFLARLFSVVYRGDVCFFSIALSAIVWLLPGLSFTISMGELATKNFLSGTTRIFYAVMISLQLGFGIAIGSGLVFWEPVTARQQTCVPPPFWVNVFFVLGASLSWNVLLRGGPRQLFPMTLTSVIAYGSSVLFSSVANLSSDLATVLSALMIGITGGIYSKLTHHASFIVIVAGIMMLVPGSIGVKGVSAFFDNDAISGITFGFEVVTIGLSICVGLFVSNVLIFPKKVLTPDTLFF